MGSATSVRPGNLQGAGAKPSGTGNAGGEAAQFQSLIGAAGAIERLPARQPAEAGEAEAPAEGDDAGMAALLAAMLPGLAPVSSAPGADAQADETYAEGDVIDELLSGSTALAEPASAVDEAIARNAALAGRDTQRDDPALLAQPEEELATALRESLPDLRAAQPARAVSITDTFSPTTNQTPHLAPPGVVSTATAAAVPGSGLQSPIASPRWAEELGSRLVMMTTRGQQEGSLSLSPEHLGPLEVRISLNHNTASVWFGAQHADTRAALAEALPRLRELFAEAGLSLGQADVSHDAPRRALQEAVDRHASGVEGADASSVSAPQPVHRHLSGLLDLYA